MKPQTVPMFDLARHQEKIEFPAQYDLFDLCREFDVFPLSVISQGGHKKLLLAMRDTTMTDVSTEVEFRTCLSVVPVLAKKEEIAYLVDRYYRNNRYAEKPTPTEEQEITQDAFEMISYVKGAY